jgi:hypothetical protein
MVSGSGGRVRRVERQWLWVGHGGHDEVLHHETRAGGIHSIPYVLVLLLYSWPVVVELRYLPIFL